MTNIIVDIQQLNNRKLSDILVTGYIDQANDIRQFHPMYEYVYFEYDDVLIRFSSVDQYWNLEISQVDQINCEFDIDDDDEFCVCSIYDSTLKLPEADNYLKSFDIYTSKDSQVDKGIVKSAALCVGNQMTTDTIFIDPENIFGISLGRLTELSEWKKRQGARDGGFKSVSWI